MERKKPFVNVDELMPQVNLEQASSFYGYVLPELIRVGSETRTACFLNCGKSKETGDRALAIQTDEPLKTWFCHQYGCGKNGNLVSLCDMMKPGPVSGGRPRGERFKEIAADLVAMVSGAAKQVLAPGQVVPPKPVAPPKKMNVILKESDNERARGLVNLDEKFVTDIAAMSPKASAYFRRRAYLTPEVCRKWRMGFLARDTGGEDRSGGTMRGKVTYCYRDEKGEPLTWFGRDPEFEEKHQSWDASDKSDREPEKFHFVKGFHRGLELFGREHLTEAHKHEKLKRLGLILVEGSNDVIRLDTLGVPALGLCSNTITRDQAALAAKIAREQTGGIVTVFLDCDTEGENGMKQCLGYLAQLCPVRLAWTSKMFAGKFKGRQPESLQPEDWSEIETYLMTGKGDGWSLSA